MSRKQYHCPLCDSLISKAQYEQVLNIDDARKREIATQEYALKDERRTLALERQRIEREAASALKEFQTKAAENTANLKAELEEAKRALREGGKVGAQEKKRIEKELATKLESRYGNDLRRLEQERDRANQRHHRDAEMWKNKFEELQRKAEARDRVHHGPDGEEELETLLRRNFPGDNIQRTGRRGDVIHTVIQRGKPCGTIVYECKRTTTWQAEFLRQLKRDMEKQDTRYGVLVSRALPPRQSGLCIRDGVIVVAPDLTHHIATILREMIVELSRAAASEERKQEKTQEVYEYLRSEDFKAAMHSIETRTNELRTALDRERSSHANWWQSREQAYNAIARQSSAINGRVQDILSASPEKQLAPVARLRP